MENKRLTIFLHGKAAETLKNLCELWSESASSTVRRCLFETETRYSFEPGKNQKKSKKKDKPA